MKIVAIAGARPPTAGPRFSFTFPVLPWIAPAVGRRQWKVT